MEREREAESALVHSGDDDGEREERRGRTPAPRAPRRLRATVKSSTMADLPVAMLASSSRRALMRNRSRAAWSLVWRRRQSDL